ncbi:iron-containing alcohol dehydrogenase [Virgibacillus sp. W0430]|uniref:iron-containing alcohol dehydrogenase n=1 Tax=Virgibacillus sp. W0430 TaxID=3391580 RepID=UPI003F48E21C
MDAFMFYNPTKLLFGKGQISKLSKEIAKFGKKVMLVYGGGSIKRNGVYMEVMEQLAEARAEVVEFPGVEANPRVTTVRRAVRVCKAENIDFVLAVGGGSVIDCAKAIVVGAKTEADVWDIITKKTRATAGLPYGAVVTIAGTGAEMSRGSVISNWDTKEKRGWGSSFSYAQFAILDPSYTFSVPKAQTVNGLVDTMTHVLEHYFNHVQNTPIQDQFCESVLKTVKNIGTQLISDLKNYNLRETAMYASTIALSDILNMGYMGDWGTHHIDHAVSAIHDIPHGGGMAILFPHWMEYVISPDNAYRFRQLAITVFEVNPDGKSDLEIGQEGIYKLRQLWKSWGAPEKLSDYGITEDTIEAIADRAVAIQSEIGNFQKLNRSDVVSILRASIS